MSLAGTEVHLVTDLESALEFKRWLGERRDGYIAVDTETSGLDCLAPGARLRTVQFGDARHGWTVPWEDWRGLALEALNSWEGEFVWHNCFDGGTEFLTSDGLRTLRDACGETVEVWTRSGWVKAEIAYFGQQPLNKVEFRSPYARSKFKRTVYVTPDHRWEVWNSKRGTYLGMTDNLSVGHSVSLQAPGGLQMDDDGFRHGLVFGDGTLAYRRKTDGVYVHNLGLYGDKSRFSSACDWVTYPPHMGGDPLGRVLSHSNYKELPDSSASPEYVAAFIEGWFRMDGHTVKGQKSDRRYISTMDKEAVEWLLRFSALGGWTTCGYSTISQHSNELAKDRDSFMYTVALIPHEESPRWAVDSIEPVEGLHDVYCAVVPDEHMFTLGNGIYTGNCNFDRRWLETHSDWKLDVSRTNDTMVASRILDPVGRAGLKHLAGTMVDRRAYAGQRRLDEGMAANGWTWGTVPVDFEPFWAYSSLDTILTSQIWDQFRPKVGKGSRLEKVYDLEMAVLDVSYKMWKRGMRVDLEYSRIKRDELLAKADELKKWAKRNHSGLLLTSPVQLGRWFTEAGVEIPETTPTGQPKVDKAFLESVVHPDSGHPVWITDVAQASLVARKCQKFASSYFENFLTNADSESIVRPNINTLAARTGRQSIRDPALQQLPKSDKMIRRAFLPHSDDELIVSVDFDQVEARILANLSRDQKLQNAFTTADATGGDFFTELGKTIFRDPHFSKDDPRRRLVKNVTYAKMYGAGLEKMSQTAGVPLDQMEMVVKRLDDTYPGILRMIEETENQVAVRQRVEGESYVELFDGRRLPVDEDHIFAGTNYRIQGTAAVLFKASQVRVDSSEWGQYAMVPVHDEIVFSIPRHLVEKSLAELPDIMSDRSGGGVPYTAGGEGGFDRWGGDPVG